MITTGQMTDELLMAFADGELADPDAARVHQAISADPELAARVAMFQETRQLARRAFADIAREPIPDGLLRSVLPKRRTESRMALLRTTGVRALAASVVLNVLAAGLLGYTLWREPASNFALLAQNEALLDKALSSDPDGRERSLPRGVIGTAASVTTGQTYRLSDGRLCRTFEIVRSGEGRVSGLSCRQGGGWRVALAVPGHLPAQDPSYQPAGGTATDLAAVLDAHHAEGPLAAEEVAALIRRNWAERQ